MHNAGISRNYTILRGTYNKLQIMDICIIVIEQGGADTALQKEILTLKSWCPLCMCIKNWSHSVSWSTWIYGAVELLPKAFLQLQHKKKIYPCMNEWLKYRRHRTDSCFHKEGGYQGASTTVCVVQYILDYPRNRSFLKLVLFGRARRGLTAVEVVVFIRERTEQ